MSVGGTGHYCALAIMVQYIDAFLRVSIYKERSEKCRCLACQMIWLLVHSVNARGGL